ncbi:uncharacterized protein TRIADDRAFT_22271 [Trichoplax adhaerens]|uniref:Pyridine nucleotide-disulfide oxidoreductase domain-containing protein 1 n=1 Tax=Trichoplax adhaerens TaxID=10228 RepID=B3RS58_TRIAD|nr:hypothetical protein TRIADDRAFT_22271 [Trichoplax adhaerens]EDV26459.1 hypothetical protein TRIADDRAFT_22271 [Trichoplax adhaerens]|eukprot:XP_002110455.1 hypothetical protein TRIADDRAFT_22271 [Trichoplax adhaerens]
MVKFLVIGGGIAGVTCAEQLSALRSDCQISLISSSPLIKAVTNFQQYARSLEKFTVEERPLSTLNNQYSNIAVFHKTAKNLDSSKHTLTTEDGEIFQYDKLCICSGASPKIIDSKSDRVIGIRDTESVTHFQNLLANSKRVMIVGNGGIATELVHEITNCRIIWTIKDDSISSTFFDVGAGQFLLPKLFTPGDEEPDNTLSKRMKFTLDDDTSDSDLAKNNFGSALGPDWSRNLKISGGLSESQVLQVEYNCEVASILSYSEYRNLLSLDSNNTDEKVSSSSSNVWPIYVKLTNGKLYGCDFVISATGVTPNIDLVKNDPTFQIGKDGGIVVDDHMKTRVANIYAAGDVCCAGWDHAPHWFQMRLWTQARQMGSYAAKCMVADTENDSISMDFCFELFAHVTKFFDYKVVLLGQYNAQKLGKDYEILLRCTKDMEFIKVILHKGRMYGAIIIGETDLEETFENLILNQMDLSRFGESLLDPSIDIEDYFD